MNLTKFRSTLVEGTIDCDHGSDLGYDRMISERLPRIRKILRKYGIR